MKEREQDSEGMKTKAHKEGEEKEEETGEIKEGVQSKMIFPARTKK